MSAVERSTGQGGAKIYRGLEDRPLCGNLNWMLSTSLDEDALSAANPMEDVDISENGLGSLRSGGLNGHEFVFGLGIAGGIHATLMLLSALAGIFFISPSKPDVSFVTVNLIQPAGCGAGMEAGGSGSGTASAAMSSQAAISLPSGGDAGKTASPQPVLADATPFEETTEKKTEISPKVSAKHTADAVKPKRTPQKTRVKKEKAVAKKVASESSQITAVDRAVSSTVPFAAQPQSQLPASGNGSSGKESNANGSGSGGAGGIESGPGGGPAGGGSKGGRGGVPGELDLKQVDIPPTVTRKVEPEFPQAARRMGISGRVVLRLLVTRDGSVGKVSVIEASPRGIFEESALDAIHKWRFSPGRYRGDAVATWVVQPIQFKLFR